MERVDLSPFPPLKSTAAVNEGFRFGSDEHPPLLGQKRPPKGKAGCLQGNIFVITGTLPAMYKVDCRDLIERYGGTVTSSLSGKTNVLIKGCIEAGPAKIKYAEERNIPIIDDDGLFYIIARSRPEDNVELIKKLESDYKKLKNMNQKSFVEIKKEERSKFIFNLSEKYRPIESSELICSAVYRNLLREYLVNYKESKYKMLIVFGNTGVGKTSFVYSIAEHLQFKVNEINSSTTRSKKNVSKFFENLNKDEKNVIFFDELESFTKDEKRGLQYIAEYSETSQYPIVFTASSLTSPIIQGILNKCQCIHIPDFLKSSLNSKIMSIASLEGIPINLEALKDISKKSRGDLRYAINQIDFWRGEGDYYQKGIDYNCYHEAAKYLGSNKSSFEERMNTPIKSEIIAEIQCNIDPGVRFAENLDYAEALDSLCLSDVIETEMEENGECINLRDPVAAMGIAIPISLTCPSEKRNAIGEMHPKVGSSLRKNSHNTREIKKLMKLMRKVGDVDLTDANEIIEIVNISEDKDKTLSDIEFDKEKFNKLSDILTFN